VRIVIGCLALLWTAPASAEVVETTRALNVYKQPKRVARQLRGRVQESSRFEVFEQKPGEGCKQPWLRIDDAAWICSSDTKATDDQAGGSEWPQLDGDEIVPHTYVLTPDARVYPTLDDAAAETHEDTIPGLGGFRVRAVQSKGGTRYVKVSEGWVPRADVRYASPSRFKAVELTAADREKRQGFVREKHGAKLHDEQGRALADPDPLPRQTFLNDLGEAIVVGKTALYPIGNDQYVLARDVGRIAYSEPPDEVTGDDARWLDVDLSEQVLVAYEGKTAVKATLVSTARTATPEGVFHISKKRAVSFMKSKPEHRNKYNLDTPWVMTLKGRIAMHAVYWHDDFGTARSHGCVNLTPQDAKWIWDWSLPTVPEGWLRVDAAERDDGTVVRIRK